MIYFHDTTQFRLEGPSAVTLGKFDGFHRGHQKLLEKITGEARKSDHAVKSVVFALQTAGGQRLMTMQEQKEFAGRAGIDVLICCPFVPEISGMQPEEFIRKILLDRLNMVYAAVGSDFRFGHHRAGDASFLADRAGRMGYRAEVVEKEKYGEREISSSYIREAVMKADMELAKQLLGRPFSVSGRVVHGAHIGSSLGFPTANMVPSEGKMLPPNGVYFTETFCRGRKLPGVTNIGCKPTVNGSFRGVETFFFGETEEFYGEAIETRLLHFRRQEKHFASLQELKRQIDADAKAGREYFFEQGVMVR